MLLIENEESISTDESIRMFIDGMNAGVWVWNMQTDSVWWSDEMYALLGYVPGEISVHREFFTAHILHPADVAAMQASAQHLIETKSSLRTELRFKHKTQGYIWFKCGGKMSFADTGEPVKMYGSMMNINDRKKAEERLAMVIDGVEAGIWEWDIVNKSVWWSEKLYDLLGYHSSDIMTDNSTFLRQIVHPDDLEAMQLALDRYLVEQTTYKVELRMLHKCGEYFWFESSGKCRVDDNGVPVKMVGSMINCHSRKVLEEQSAHSQFLLNETGRISKVGGWEVDLLTNRPYWSKATYDIHEVDYNYQPDLESAIDFFHPDYREAIRTAVERAGKFGEPYEMELQFTTAKKRLIWVKAYGEPVYNDLGEIVKLRGIFMDIDHVKRSEIDLKKSLELLARQNEQLSGFSHILSHNLRNHAGNISIIANMLAEESNMDDQKELIQNLRKVSGRLNGTLDDMGEALKKREDNSLQKELLPVADIYHELTEVLSSTIASHNIKLSSTFEVSHVFFPRIYMESILMNLISNAIKYRKQHISPIINIATYVDKESGRICLECTDNGLGIDLKRNGAKLFNLYKTFHTNKDAHGVGLFLIRTQIESQGGEISVNSKPGVGSCFRVLF